jgi:sugar lactone lactonase YvrE
MEVGMFCPNCGRNNVDGARFCKGCGASLDDVERAHNVRPYDGEQAVPGGAIIVLDKASPDSAAYGIATSRGSLSRKTVGIIAIIAICVTVFIVLTSNGLIGRGGAAGDARHSLFTVTDYDREETHLIYDGKLLDESLDGVGFTRGNEYGSVWLGWIHPQHYDVFESELYCIDGGSVEYIANSHEAMLSRDGNTAYFVEDDTLYEYDVSSGERNWITDVNNDDYLTILKISPNGKILIYQKNFSESGEVELWYWSNGKEGRIGDNSHYSLALSDAGDLYYSDYERGALYYQNIFEGASVKIDASDLGYADYRCVVNADQTQILFCENSVDYSDVYFSENGSEKIKLGGLNMVRGVVQTLGNPGYDYYSSNVEDFRGQLVYDLDGSVYLIDNDLETERIVRDAGDYFLSQDGKTLYYWKAESGDLYRMDAKPGAEDERIVRDAVVGISISPDERTFYHIDEYRDLYFVKGADEPVYIADDVRNLYMSRDGRLHFIADVSERSGLGTLYACTSDKDVERIADDVDQVFRDNDDDVFFDILAYTVKIDDDEYDYYVGSSKDFKCVLEGIDITEEIESGVPESDGGSATMYDGSSYGI